MEKQLSYSFLKPNKSMKIDQGLTIHFVPYTFFIFWCVISSVFVPKDLIFCLSVLCDGELIS